MKYTHCLHWRQITRWFYSPLNYNAYIHCTAKEVLGLVSQDMCTSTLKSLQQGNNLLRECTYKGIPILPQHFPLYSSREGCSLLPYLLHLWAMTYIICEWGNRHCEGSVLPPGPYMYSSTNASRLDNHWLKKKKNYLKYCICTCTLEVNRLFLNINVTLMSGHSTHGPWCHCLLLVSGTGGEGYLIHIVTILHILHLKNTM